MMSLTVQCLCTNQRWAVRRARVSRCTSARGYGPRPTLCAMPAAMEISYGLTVARGLRRRRPLICVGRFPRDLMENWLANRGVTYRPYSGLARASPACIGRSHRTSAIVRIPSRRAIGDGFDWAIFRSTAPVDLTSVPIIV